MPLVFPCPLVVRACIIWNITFKIVELKKILIFQCFFTICFHFSWRHFCKLDQESTGILLLSLLWLWKLLSPPNEYFHFTWSSCYPMHSFRSDNMFSWNFGFFFNINIRVAFWILNENDKHHHVSSLSPRRTNLRLSWLGNNLLI